MGNEEVIVGVGAEALSKTLNEKADTIRQLRADKAETEEFFRRIDWFCSGHTRREMPPAHAAMSFEVGPTMGGALCAEMYISSAQRRGAANNFPRGLGDTAKEAIQDLMDKVFASPKSWAIEGYVRGPTPPIVQELERADELDAAENVLAENLAASDAGRISSETDVILANLKSTLDQQVADSVRDFSAKLDAMFLLPRHWAPTLELEFIESDLPADLLEKLAPFKASWQDTGISVEVLATVATVKGDDDLLVDRYELDDWRLADPVIEFDPGVDLCVVIELLHEFVEERVASEPVEVEEPE